MLDWENLMLPQYRALRNGGNTSTHCLSRHRDVNAAKAFLRKAMKGRRATAKVTLDAYAASHRAVAELKKSGELQKGAIVHKQLD